MDKCVFGFDRSSPDLAFQRPTESRDSLQSTLDEPNPSRTTITKHRCPEHDLTGEKSKNSNTCDSPLQQVRGCVHRPGDTWIENDVQDYRRTSWGESDPPN
ncbi:hypothetical protein ILUMI_21264 [Ignelater luminosus]|uniref:Uncharacterized protein n=1 Tax=Ignelater luminosus TaxID=2038154 RepID=A0A8K0G412_IGNLU|nr:hypothetical protein ILUMI_21264 [Ignelater luminosus]